MEAAEPENLAPSPFDPPPPDPDLADLAPPKVHGFANPFKIPSETHKERMDRFYDQDGVLLPTPTACPHHTTIKDRLYLVDPSGSIYAKFRKRLLYLRRTAKGKPARWKHQQSWESILPQLFNADKRFRGKLEPPEPKPDREPDEVDGVKPIPAFVDPERFQSKKCSYRKSVEWAWDNLATLDPKPETCPSGRAWSLLHDARSSSANRKSFFATHVKSIAAEEMEREKPDEDDRVHPEKAGHMRFLADVKKMAEKAQVFEEATA